MIELAFYLFGLFLLIWFSYVDYKTKEVGNEYTIPFFLLAMVILLIEKSLIVGLLMLITSVIAGYMWKLKIIGGADVKILPSIMPFMLIGSANYFIGYFNFLIVFLCVGTSYGLIYKEFFKKKRTKYVPFVPAIAITYVLFAILYLI